MEADGSDAIPAWPGSTPIGYFRGTASNKNAERHVPFAFDMSVIGAFVYFSPPTTEAVAAFRRALLERTRERVRLLPGDGVEYAFRPDLSVKARVQVSEVVTAALVDGCRSASPHR